MRRQIPPLPDRQVPQVHAANAHALKARHKQANLLAHAANLALFAFREHKAQLLGVLPADLRWLQWLAVQAQSVAQQAQLVSRENVLHIEHFAAVADTHQILFFDV